MKYIFNNILSNREEKYLILIDKVQEYKNYFYILDLILNYILVFLIITPKFSLLSQILFLNIILAILFTIIFGLGLNILFCKEFVYLKTIKKRKDPFVIYKLKVINKKNNKEINIIYDQNKDGDFSKNICLIISISKREFLVLRKLTKDNMSINISNEELSKIISNENFDKDNKILKVQIVELDSDFDEDEIIESSDIIDDLIVSNEIIL